MCFLFCLDGVDDLVGLVVNKGRVLISTCVVFDYKLPYLLNAIYRGKPLGRLWCNDGTGDSNKRKQSL